MKNSILLDRRINRQRTLTEPLSEPIDRFKHLSIIDTETAFTSLLKHLDFKDFSDFKEYTTIILHRSDFQNYLNLIHDYAVKYSKNLVLFSGSITASTLTQEKESNILSLNDRTLYSEHLIDFLKSEDSEILSLMYGEKWEANGLIQLLDRLNAYIYSYKKEVPYNFFEKKLALLDHEKHFFESLIGSKPIEKVSLEKIQNKIHEAIVKTCAL